MKISISVMMTQSLFIYDKKSSCQSKEIVAICLSLVEEHVELLEAVKYFL